MGTTLTKLWILVILGILTCEVQGCKWHQNSKISEGQGMLPMANLIDDRRLEVYPDIPFSRINVITDVPQLKTRSAKSKRSLVFRFPKRNSMNTFRNVRSFKDLKPIKPLENVSSTPLKKIESTPHSEIKNESVIRIEKPGGIDKDTTTFVNKDERGVTLIGRSTLPQRTTAQNKSIEKELTTTIKPESTSVELIRETKTQKGDILKQKIDVKEILKSSMKQTTAIRPSLSSKFQFKGNNLSTVKHKTTSVEQKSQRKIPKKVEKNIGYHKKDVNQIIKLSQKQTTAFKPTSDRFHFTKGIQKKLSTTVTHSTTSVEKNSQTKSKELAKNIGYPKKDVNQINKHSMKKQKIAFVPSSGRLQFTKKGLQTRFAPGPQTSVGPRSQIKTTKLEKYLNTPEINVKQLSGTSKKHETVLKPFSMSNQFTGKQMSNLVLPKSTLVEARSHTKSKKTEKTIHTSKMHVTAAPNTTSGKPKSQTRTKKLERLVDNRKINLRQSFKSLKKQKLAFIPLSRRFKFIEKELTTTIAPDTTTVERKSETKTRQHEQLADQPDLDVEKILQSSQKQTTVFRPFSRRFQNFQARNAASFTFSRKPKKIQEKQKEVQDEDISFKLLKLLSNTTIKLSTTMSPYASKSEPQIQATSISTTPVSVELTTHDTTFSVASKEPINYPNLNVISKLNYLQQQLNKIKNQKKQEIQKSATKEQPVKQPSVVKEQAKDYVGEKNLLHKSSDIETMQTIMTSIGKAIKLVNSKSNLSKDTMKLLQKKVANLKSRIATRNGLIPSMSLSNIVERTQKSEPGGTASKEPKRDREGNINVTKKISKKTVSNESKVKVAEVSLKQESQNKNLNDSKSVTERKVNTSSSISDLNTFNTSKTDFDLKVEKRNKISPNMKVPFIQDNLLEWRPMGEVNQDFYSLKKKPNKMNKSEFYETPVKISKIRKNKKQKRRKPPKVKGDLGLRNKGLKSNNRRKPPMPKPPNRSQKDWLLTKDKNIPDPPQDLTFNAQGQSLNKFTRNVPPQSFNSKSDFVASQVDPMNKRPTYSDWINLKTGFRTKDPAEIRFEFSPVPSESVGKSKTPFDSSIPLPPSDNAFPISTPIPNNMNSIYGKRIPDPPMDPYQAMKENMNNPYNPPQNRNQRVQMKPEKQFNEQLFQNNNGRNQRVQMKPEKGFNEQLFQNSNAKRPWSKPDRVFPNKVEKPFEAPNSRLMDNKRRDWNNRYNDRAPYSRIGPTTSLNGWGINENRRNKNVEKAQWNRKNPARDPYDSALQSKIQFYENSRGGNSMRNHEGRHKPYDRPNMAINKREMFNERQMMQRGEIGPMAQRGNTLYNREPFWGTPIPFQRQKSQNWWATTPSIFMNGQMYMNPFVNNFGLNFGMRSNYNPAYPQGPQPWQQQRVESTTSKYEVARDFLDTFWQKQQGEANFDKSLGKGNFRQRFVPIKPSPLDNSPPKMKRIWKAKKAGGEIIHEYAKIFPYMELIYIFSSFKSAILIDYHHNKMALKFKLPSSVATYGEVCFIKSAPYTFTKAESEIRQRETAKTVDVVEGGILYAELSGRIKRGQVRKMAGPEIYDFCNTAISKGHIFKLVSEPMADVGSTNFHASGLPSGQTKGPVSTMTITVDNAIDLNARM